MYVSTQTVVEYLSMAVRNALQRHGIANPLGKGLMNVTKGLPFQVTWCWNGLIVLESEPFYRGVKFRSSVAGECSASECALLAKDFWKLGFGRALIVPSVKLTYWGKFSLLIDLAQAFEKVHRDLPPFAVKHPDFNEEGNVNNGICPTYNIQTNLGCRLFG